MLSGVEAITSRSERILWMEWSIVWGSPQGFLAAC